MTGIATNLGSVQRFQRAMSLSRRLGASVFDGTAAAYSVRIPAGSTYSGPLLRVRRSSDNAEQNIFAVTTADANGNRFLDEQALTLFCGAPKYPLDGISSGGGFSLRLLRTAYTGFAIRVRRSNDNAELNIGFTSGGELDTVALLTFTGANSGFVTTWYDQSGNGRNATQATAGAQPRIVNAGVVDTLGGKPTMVGDGLTQGFDAPGVDTLALNAVVRPSVNNGGAGPYRGITATNTMMMLSHTDGTNRWGTYSTIGQPANSQLLANTNYVATMTGGGFWLNGAANGSYSATSGQTFRRIFGQTSSGQSFTGSISEVIWLTTALSTTDRENLERSQAAYYGVTYSSTISSAFITTWYDQSGNGRNATQTTSAAQPRIVNAGVVDVINTKPAVFFSGSTWLLTPRFVISGGHVISLVSSVSDNNTRRLFSQGNTGGQLTPTGVTFRSVGASGWNFSNNSGGAVTGGSNSGLQINTATNQNGSLTVRRNGTQVASGSGGGGGNITAPYTSNISGFENGSGELYFGYAPEILLFSGFTGTTPVLNLERSQGAAFGITVA